MHARTVLDDPGQFSTFGFSWPVVERLQTADGPIGLPQKRGACSFLLAA